MLQNLTGWHALIILAVIVLLFGAAKLPVLAKSVGQSMKIFKNEIKTPAADPATASAAPTAVPVAEPIENPSASTAAPVAGTTETHLKP